QAFEGVSKRLVVGKPVRKEVLALAGQPKAEQQALRVLVVGGSLGALVFNQQLPKQIAALSAQGGLDVWHQTGQAGLEQVQAEYRQLGLAARVEAFIDEMAAAYHWADLVVCRAGALTVSELACAGVPAVFV